MDPNVVFSGILDFIRESHAMALRGQTPSVQERRQQRERFDTLSQWTDGGGFCPAPIVIEGIRYRWDPLNYCVDTMPMEDRVPRRR